MTISAVTGSVLSDNQQVSHPEARWARDRGDCPVCDRRRNQGKYDRHRDERECLELCLSKAAISKLAQNDAYPSRGHVVAQKPAARVACASSFPRP